MDFHFFGNTPDDRDKKKNCIGRVRENKQLR